MDFTKTKFIHKIVMQELKAYFLNKRIVALKIIYEEIDNLIQNGMKDKMEWVKYTKV
jgi:uncharacterized protein YqgQ